MEFAGVRVSIVWKSQLKHPGKELYEASKSSDNNILIVKTS